MKTFNFENRDSEYPGRKKLKIVSQTADTMVVDVEFADGPRVEGTAINAEIMQEFQQGIVDANTTSGQALTISNNANSVANNASTTAGQAIAAAQDAKTLAQEAKTASTNTQTEVNDLKVQVVSHQGTKVAVGGVYVSIFDADTKADKAIENNPILKNVVFDSVTNTYIF